MKASWARGIINKKAGQSPRAKPNSPAAAGHAYPRVYKYSSGHLTDIS